MKLMKTLAAVLAVSLLSFAQAGQRITVSAAASLKDALTEVAATFKQAHPGDEIGISYTSSGKAVAAIKQGLPADVFFAADMKWPQELVNAGLAQGPAKPFAMGRLALWSSSIPAKQLSFQLLLQPQVQKIAIAKPELAPYGARTVEALKAEGIYEKVQSKLVYGENISAAAQYALSGNTQVGFVALSLAMAPEMTSKGHYILVDEKLHQPLAQGYVILKQGETKPLSKQFVDFVLSHQGQAIFAKYGFSSPKK
nr:molybdate ABC transporter substrate-binding protein [uncultured Holophaga sp.]